MRTARPSRCSPACLLRTPLSRALLCAALTLALVPAGAGSSAAATALAWSGGATNATATGPVALSCPTSSLCVAVDAAGRALTGDPAAGLSTWTGTGVSTAALTGVSCTSSGACAAVDETGRIFAAASPTGTWSEVGSTSVALSGVSCAPGLCVAVGASGDAFVSAGPTAAFTPVHIDGSNEITGVSCLSASFCVAVDNDGNALASFTPTTTAWSVDPIAAKGSPLLAVACEASGYCAATDETGSVLVSGNPTASETTPGAAGPEWSATNLDAGALPALSCASGACVTVSSGGESFASEDLATRPATWSESPVGLAATDDDAISCVSGSICVAVGAPSPSGPLEAFEAALPQPPAKERPVEKPPVEKPAAESPPAKLPPLVTPKPLIAGDPAAGQTLTCETGIPEGVSATVSYQWFANQKPIAGATNPKYKVRSGDEGDHLQCAVTATNAAGSVEATSGWVAVPRARAPKSIGETSVSKASTNADKVSFAVECSARAVGHCEVEARLIVFERLRAGRLLSASASGPATEAGEEGEPAHRGETGHGGEPARRGETAGGVRTIETTIGSLKVTVKAAHTRTLSVRLNAAGRRLLATLKKALTARLLVSGTVIGVLSGQLSSQRIRLSTGGSSAKHSKPKHAARFPAARFRTAARATVATASHPPKTAAARQLAFAESELGAPLAPTPYMGWESWFALGTEIDEATALEQASELVQLGLQKLGYDYVWLDAGWWQGKRSHKGAIEVSHAQWPRGIAGVAETLHDAGLKLGVYTDAGREGCNAAHAGSYGHYKQDVNTFASWGVDAIKVDFCGGSQQKLNPRAAYTRFHEAIVHDDPHRPMLLEVCNFLQAGSLGHGRPSVTESSWGSYAFGPEIGNSWRTETDIGSPGRVRFGSVLRNLDADATHPEAAGPGHWNEPDYLVPEEGLSNAQFRTQVSMWAILAAPMMISTNLEALSSQSLEALTNEEVIAVDQDPGGVQGTLVAAAGEGEVWSRPLSDGSFAVALLNRAKATIPVETTATAVGLPESTTYEVRNLWTHATSTSTGTIAATVPGDSTVLLRVFPVGAGATSSPG